MLTLPSIFFLSWNLNTRSSYAAYFGDYKKPKSPDDLEERIRRAAQGDRDMQEWLVQNVGPMVAHNARQWIKSGPEDVDDFIGLCLMKLLQSLKQYQHNKYALTTFVYWQQLSVRSKWFQARRTAKRTGREVSLDALLDLPTEDTETAAFDDEDDFYHRIRLLPALERRVVVLRFLMGKTIAEIAREINRSYSYTNNKILGRALKRLADQDLQSRPQLAGLYLDEWSDAPAVGHRSTGRRVGSVDRVPGARGPRTLPAGGLGRGGGAVPDAAGGLSGP